MSSNMGAASSSMCRGLKRQAREIAEDEMSPALTVPGRSAPVYTGSSAHRLFKKTTVTSKDSRAGSACSTAATRPAGIPTRRLSKKTKVPSTRKRIKVKSTVFHPSYVTAYSSHYVPSALGEDYVNPKKHLLQILDGEVEHFKAVLQSTTKGSAMDDGTGMIRCPFCVYKSFRIKGGNWKRLLTRHLGHAHVRQAMYVGGSKTRSCARSYQRAVMQALYNGERLRDVQGDDYLGRSADIIRNTSCDRKVSMRSSVGDKAVLVLDVGGPRFTSRASALNNVNIWRATKRTWLTRSFVEAALVALFQHDGQIRGARRSLILKFTQAGSEIALLTPTHQHEIWMGIAELFLKSAKYAREKTALTMKSLRNHEFDHVKIDGTVRLLRRVKGQADFLCSAATRAIAPLNDADSIRRIISFIGRTGSVLALKLRRDEAALTIATTLRDEFPLECRQQISTVSVDFCTPAMWEALSKPDVCPNLHLLCLDATHICMKYRAAFGRRKTEGCVWLSRVMAKFSKANDMLGVFHWGAPYHGDGCRPHSLAESNARQQLMEGTMLLADAKGILTSMHCDGPWLTRLDFVKAIAAVCSVYPDEALIKTQDAGKSIRQLLWNLTSPQTCEWLFNNLRSIARMSPSRRPLLPSGTTANEAMHFVLNKAFRNLPEVYSGTLEVQVSLLQYSRLKSHTSALNTPTLSQMRNRDVRALSQASIRFSPADWTEMTSRAIVDTDFLRQRNLVKTKIREAGVFIKKRHIGEFAGRLTLTQAQCVKRIRKRTVFTLKRVRTPA